MSSAPLLKIGAKIALATSRDEDYPPENIIDGKTGTFWATTGLFPQEFIISFKSVLNIQQITIFCYNVLDLEIECSKQSILDCQKWEPLVKQGLVQNKGEITKKEFLVNTSAHHLRFVIASGYDHFACVYNVGITTSS